MAKVRVLNLPTEKRFSPNERFERDLDGPNGYVDSQRRRPDAYEALGVAPFYGCVRHISDTVGTLPMDSYRRIDRVRRPFRPRPEWLNFNTRGEFNRINLIETIMVSLLVSGNAYLATFRDSDGQIIYFRPLNPDMVEPRRTRQGIVYDVVDGRGRVEMTPLDILHIPGKVLPGELKGRSVLEHAAIHLGTSLNSDGFTESFYRNDARPGVVVEAPDSMSETAVRVLRDTWDDVHRGVGNAHKLAVLTEGAKINTITTPAKDAQLIETKRWQVPTICMFFGVHPYWLGYTDAPVFGNSVSAMNTFFQQHVLRTWVERIEQGLSDAQRMGSMLAPELADQVFIGLNMNAFTRGDRDTRIQTNVQAVREGIITINEAREMEDLPPVEWGDEPISVQVQEAAPGGLSDDEIERQIRN